MRIARYVAYAIPVVFLCAFLVISHIKWSDLHLGLPLLPVVVLGLPLVAVYINNNNRRLWQRLDELEEVRAKFKSVCSV